MDDNDLPAMRRNLKKARGMWYRLSRVLDKESVPGPVAGMFYQAVMASQLLFGSGTWVLPPLGLKCLEGFHVEAMRRLTGTRSRMVKGKWVYPHPADVLKAAGLCTVAKYIARQRANIAKTIEGRKILEDCRGAARRLGTPARTYWWEQELTVEGGGQRGGGEMVFDMHRGGGGNTWTRGERQRPDAFGDRCNRLRRQQAEELGIVMEEEKEMEDPLPPWHHRTGVGEAAPEVEGREEREACLPLELRNSLLG